MSHLSDTAHGAAPGSPRLRWAVAAMLTAAAMDLIDTTIVNVAAPAIRADLAASTAQIEWTVASYALVFGVALIPGARLGDRFGHRPVFLAGVAGFVLSSLLSGLAPSPDVLVVARALQGAAAAVMIPQILTVIQIAIPAEHRSTAYAGYGATAAIGTVSGPLMGGLLLSLDPWGLGWRTVFLLNVPVGLAALGIAAATLPVTGTSAGRRLDLAGAAILALTLMLVLFPMVEGPQRGWPAWVVALLVAAGPALAAFVVHQRRREAAGRDPLVALSLFVQRAFVGGVAAQVALYAGVTGFFLVLALTLQDGQGFTALRTGLTFVAWSLGIAVSSGATGALAPRLGRHLSVAGALVMAFGMLVLLVGLTASGPRLGPGTLAPGLFIAGLGMGAVAPTLVDTSLREVRTDDAGAASGLVTTAGQLGGALGVAGLGAVYFSALGRTPTGTTYTDALITGIYYELAVLVTAAAVMLLIPRPAPPSGAPEGR